GPAQWRTAPRCSTRAGTQVPARSPAWVPARPRQIFDSAQASRITNEVNDESELCRLLLFCRRLRRRLRRGQYLNRRRRSGRPVEALDFCALAQLGDEFGL